MTPMEALIFTSTYPFTTQTILEFQDMAGLVPRLFKLVIPTTPFLMVMETPILDSVPMEVP